MKYKSKDWGVTKILLGDRPFNLSAIKLANSLYTEYKQTNNTDLLNFRVMIQILEHLYKWKKKEILKFTTLYAKLTRYSKFSTSK